MNATSFRTETQYPVYISQEEDVRTNTTKNEDVQPEGRNYKTSDSRMSSDVGSSRSYGKAVYSQPNTYPLLSRPVYKKMDMQEAETSTKTITSYDAERGPVYKHQYGQAEPPSYPPLGESESAEISSVKDTQDSGYSNPQDMSYLPQPEDVAYYKPSYGDVSSYESPRPGTDDLMPAMKPKKPKPAMKEVPMGKFPIYPSAHHSSDYLPSKPTGMKMPDKDYDYIPYNMDDEEHYLPYNPELGGHMFGHSSQQTAESDENGDNDDLHHHPPMKTKPKDSEETKSHEVEDEDDFIYHFPKFHGKEPSPPEEPSGGKMKPDFHMYSSAEDEGDDDKSTKPKSKPPPEIYYSGPHKPLHNYDSYLDHEPEDHKEGDDEQYHHEHEDHESDHRLNKQPYSYYYLGRKLWYIPLYFSVYFIIYVTALILKSIARHKIRYPITHWSSRSLSGDETHIEDISANVTKALNSSNTLFMR